MDSYLALALAIFGLATGGGKLLSESVHPRTRQWGKGFEVGAPLAGGAFALASAIFLNTPDLKGWLVAVVAVFGLALYVWGVREWERKGWLKPTE